ncbi:ECF transporter S component [Thermohalobacter berrensis]|uniref:Riboflavin transporter n=1 Tax=Thermohalobacter berrensis TaxID=99594 RepID=A0A419T6W6_9FIRM|nr:ECF transporter S component [Thermohalobacter berrensis]RKD33159.1 hypothetical protein BET03_09575 [Thermohalobacter berrensis]
MKLTNSSINNQIKVALLGAISFILMFLNISIPFFPPFLKLDISDLPVIIGLLTIGLNNAIWISVIKNILHLFVSQSLGIGELINFIIITTYILIFYISYKKFGKILSSLIIATIGTSFISIPVNYYIMFPLYRYILNIKPESILKLAASSNPLIHNFIWYFAIIIFPFNIIKFSILSLTSFFVCPLIQKKIYFIKNKKGDFK